MKNLLFALLTLNSLSAWSMSVRCDLLEDQGGKLKKTRHCYLGNIPMYSVSKRYPFELSRVHIETCSLTSKNKTTPKNPTQFYDGIPRNKEITLFRKRYGDLTWSNDIKVHGYGLEVKISIPNRAVGEKTTLDLPTGEGIDKLVCETLAFEALGVTAE